MKPYILVLLILFFLIVGFENISKVFYRRMAKKRPQAHKTIDFLITGDENVFGKFTPRSFGLYWNRGNYFIDGKRQTNPQGYRSHSDQEFKVDSSRFRILVLGSSTTYSDHFSIDPKTSWPIQMENILRNKGKQNVDVINAGLNYATSAELISHYVFFATHIKPNLVIFDGPGNDFLPVAVGDTTKDYSRTRKSLLILPRRGEKLLLRSQMIKLAYFYFVNMMSTTLLEPPNHKHDTEKAKENLINTFPEVFEGNIRVLADLLKGQNIPLILVDFLRPSSLKTFYPISWQGIQDFDIKSQQIFEKIANHYGLMHITKNDLSFPDHAFMDSCHLNITFEKEKATIIADRIYNGNYFS